MEEVEGEQATKREVDLAGTIKIIRIIIVMIILIAFIQMNTRLPKKMELQLLVESLSTEDDGGASLTYCAHIALPRILRYAEEAGLRYRWTLCLKHSGAFARGYG